MQSHPNKLQVVVLPSVLGLACGGVVGRPDHGLQQPLAHDVQVLVGDALVNLGVVAFLRAQVNEGINRNVEARDHHPLCQVLPLLRMQEQPHEQLNPDTKLEWNKEWRLKNG